MSAAAGRGNEYGANLANNASAEAAVVEARAQGREERAARATRRAALRAAENRAAAMTAREARLRRFVDTRGRNLAAAAEVREEAFEAEEAAQAQMRAAARGAAAGAAAAGAAAAGAAGAAAVAGPHYYVFYTDPNAAVPHRQMVFRSDLNGSWNVNIPTTINRIQLARSIMDRTVFCEPNVSPDYVEGQLPFDVNPLLFVVSRMPEPPGKRDLLNADGFILARFMEHETDGKGLYLDVVCANQELKIGHALIKFFHTFAWDHGANYVKLSSLANVLVYYHKQHQYRFRHSCAGPVLTELSPALAERDFRARPAPVSTPDAYKDADFMNFMYTKLYRENPLVVRDDNRCATRPPRLSRRQFASLDCATDGFTMIKCTRGGARGGKRRSTRRHRRTYRRTHH